MLMVYLCFNFHRKPNASKVHTYPGVLPFVRHRYDVFIVQILPFRVSAMFPGVRGCGHVRVTLEPLFCVVIVELLAPQQARIGLARH